MDFKDKFFPGIHWQRNTQPGMGMGGSSGAPSQSSFGLGDSLRSSALESRTESMHVDNILAGKKYDDV